MGRTLRGLVALRAAITAAAAMALLAPVAAQAAVPGIQDDRISVVGSNDIEARLNAIGDTGAKVARVDLYWSEIAPTKPANPDDPGDPAYQFDRMDQILSGMAARGITPLITVYSSPTWANGGKKAPKGQLYNPYTPNPIQFGRFMGAVARRYGGDFPLGQYALAPPKAHLFEIWNEPNLGRYYLPQFKRGKPVSPSGYAGLVKAAYGRIKLANPHATVIAGVAGPTSTTKKRGRTVDIGIGSLEWLKDLRTLKRRLPLDAYSQHIYPAAPPTSKAVAIPNWASVPLLLKEINGIHKNLPLYITEAGYTTQVTPIRQTVVSISKQARYLKQIFGLKSIRNRRIPAVIWFNLQDNPVWPGGLERLDGSKKPSFAAFQAVARRTKLTSVLRP